MNMWSELLLKEHSELSALLINIRPLAKEDSAESLLAEFVAELSAPYVKLRDLSPRTRTVLDRAKALLQRDKP